MLKVVNTVSEVKSYLKSKVQPGTKVGFVPTMGALHLGHISLVNRAKEENDLVTCSIFINPVQFNNRQDLINYPKTPQADFTLLSNASCNLLFEPSEHEVYPKQSVFDMDFGELEQVMEGKFRPGHFKGVAKVVSRLFEIMEPDRAYFGEKDFQQVAVIKEMARRINSPVQIVSCPTLRDERGLALSSRNIHLTKTEFQSAPIIYESLLQARKAIYKHGIAGGKQELISMIEFNSLFKVQYLEFVDSATLLPIENIDDSKEQRVCVAVLTSKTRLIDNAQL